MRKIPPKEKVVETIKKVIKSRKMIFSSEELASLVTRALRKEDKNFVVSACRVKKIALEIPEVEIRAKTKRSEKIKKVERCPICSSPLKPIFIKNLAGKKVIIGFACTKCGYKSNLEAFMPMEYVYVWKG